MKSAAVILIIAPVIVLTLVAACGLAEYRHAVTAEARKVVEEWAGRAPQYLRLFEEQLAEIRPVRLYPEVPMESP
jgi:hypothetical protein